MPRALEITHLPESKHLQLSLVRDGQRLIALPVPFPDTIDGAQYEELGWYFRDYLHSALDSSSTRAEKVESGLRDLGRLLFEVVFRGSDEARSHYAAACSDGLDQYQLAIISADPSFLALPWELMNEADEGYLASRLASVVRQPVAGPLPQSSGQWTNQQLNVLLVSPMPHFDTDSVAGSEIPPSPPFRKGGTGAPGFDEGLGEATKTLEVEFDSLAIETLSALDSLNVEVELEYLRPATFAALWDHLANRQGYYHLVHFDGVASSGPGVLEFEAEDGTGGPVEISRLAELLAVAGVPVALLNSGKTDSANVHQNWSETAAKLASGGVAAVVSLPYSLCGPARDLFLRPFYRAIAQGKDAYLAVAQGRKSLMDSPQRPAASGRAVFWDWIVPTVYQSQSYVPPIITEQQTPALSDSQSEEAEHGNQLPQGGPYGLVGRRAEIRHLESLFLQAPVVLLCGDTGVGKTELALALARWLQNTRSRTGGVFYTTFEAGAGLERAVHEAGTSLAGLGFADMTAEQQRRWLVEYFRDHPSLLIWDELQNISGFPNQGSGLLEEEERTELDTFLQEITSGGQSQVLLVGRSSSEPWLSTPHVVHELAGLDRRDALELSTQIMEKAGMWDQAQEQSTRQRLGSDHLDLLDLLQGHPLALQIALPLLKQVPASILVKEIGSSIGQLAPNDGEEARAPCLTAVMDYSFSRMSRRSRAHLPFLSLFQRRVMMDILTHITQEQSYREAMGEELGWGACRTLLRAACDAGFLETVTPSVYQIHPSFPWFYGRQLHQQVSVSGINHLEQEFVRVYADTADYFMESIYENQDSGATAVLAEEGNLTQALALALEARQWDSAQLLLQPLAQVYRMQKRYPELRRLRRQILETVAPGNGGATEAEALGAVDLWLYLTGTSASEAADLGQLDQADDLNQQLLAYLTSQPEGDADPRTAAVHHQLGVVAQQRWRLEEAEELFSLSLAIIEQSEDRAAVADDYYCLGQIKQHQRRYTEAHDWFSKALEIHQRLNDPEEMVKDYRALGLASQYKFENDEAESWYQRAREIAEENRDEETAVLVFHELGTVCHARYQFDEAENWYRQALTLSDRLGKDDQMAVEFHHLGLLAQARELFYEDAAEWYQLALEKYETLGDRKRAGDECRQLGVLFHEQKRLDEAEQWYIRACEVFEEVRDIQGTARTYGQLGMVAEEQDDLPGALEWAARTYRLVTENDLPFLAQVKSHLARLRSKYGPEQFTAWWQGYMAGDPPDDLDMEEG